MSKERQTRRIEFDVPYPPSANTIWRQGNGKTWLSPKYKAFITEVKATLLSLDEGEEIGSQDVFSVTIELFPSDRRKRDIDNAVKPLFDAITKSKQVWEDDSQVVALTVVKGSPAKTPFAHVAIARLNETRLIPSPTDYGIEKKC